METRILQNEIRNMRASNVEIRIGESSIIIGGSLPIGKLSSPITDRKTGKKFREMILPRVFQLALLTNRANGYKTKLLKNHNYDLEFEYNKEFEFQEIDEQELRFVFEIPKTQRNLELLEDINEENASFSFGFTCERDSRVKSKEAGIDYIRKIELFDSLMEISILDRFTAGAYPQAKGFKSLGKADAEAKGSKFVTNKAREKQMAKDKELLKEMKAYIVKEKNNQVMRELAGLKRL